MLWAVRNERLSGTQFNFNCYRQWYTLVVHYTEDGRGKFLNRKDGVTQGDPLYMITHGIGVLPLIIYLWDAPPPCHPTLVCG